MTNDKASGFRKVPYTGVIYVMHRAAEEGYTPGDPTWANLGQGAPQTDNLPGVIGPRISSLTIDPTEHEYSPISGQRQLREKVADLYNYLFRQKKRSKYTWENVSISGGCRVGLTRIAAILGNINMGHFLPDYTAYEELLSIFKSFIPIPILLDPLLHYQKSLAHIEDEITGRGLKALLMSNPCNPTGQVVMGEELDELVQLVCRYKCTLIMDEAYSHYIYKGLNETDVPTIISAAEYIEDINRDPVIIVDGVTKNWRYPGWRIGWSLGPKDIIESLSSAGSFLDGGPNHPIQKAVIELLDPEKTLQEAIKLQSFFQQKRDYVLKRLYDMGMQIEVEPRGAFYVWVNLSFLPKPLNDGISFFEAGLKEKVITVPGVFFDVNPEKRRTYARYSQYCRISFGPAFNVLKQGLDAIERVIKYHR